MNRYWQTRALAADAYPAFRRWLRRVIPHATRARLLALVRPAPAPVAAPPPPRLTPAQRAAFERLLGLLDLPATPDAYLGPAGVPFTDQQHAHLRALLDFLPAASQAGAGPRLIAASDLPAEHPPLPRLNLLFVCGEFPNPVTGGGGAVFDLIRAQSRAHNIYLCAWYQPDQDAEALRALEPFCRAIKLTSMHEMEAASPGFLNELLGGARMDVVHYYWPRALACYDPGLGRQHLFTHVECVSLRLLKDMQLAAPFGAAWRKRFAELVTALKVELVDTAPLAARITVTQVDGEFLARLDPRRPCVVLGVPVDFEAAALPEQAPDPGTLVFVGNYLHYPNADAALFFCRDIFPLVRQAQPEARLYLVGANPPPAVRALHDGEHIIVTGMVPDVRPYIQRAAVCLAPLISGAGLRTKINHYSALRRACVATSLAAVELPYTHGQEIWVADEPAGFAQGVIQMLANPELASAMGEAAYHKACAHYDVPVITERFYHLYHALQGTGLAPASPAPEASHVD
jgi:glycosyltransferase involved in cell wall biosynthesis